MTSWNRRDVLRAGMVSAVAGGFAGALPAAAGTRSLRLPDSLPDPHRPAGTPDPSMPFEHIVIVMMENRSFDHYFGMLPRRGQPAADGFTFDAHGNPTNRNPLKGGYVPVFNVDGNPCGASDSGSQSWNDTHIQMANGAMNGFAKTGPGSMAYYTEAMVPFYYSLAKTFTLNDRWFCSAPCQTYPNRRFLMAGTAYGNISTETSSIYANGKFAAPPPNGTIFDRMNAHGVSWKNYFTDLAQTLIIPSSFFNNPGHIVPIADFFTDCAAGTLPSVSYVDPEFGAFAEVGGGLESVKVPTFATTGAILENQNGDEENPADVELGETFVHQVVNAVISSPQWPKTLLVWFYDEHGGWYDHVKVPAAVKPDGIPPQLTARNVPGDYGTYGPRVPAVVVSPYSKPGQVTHVVHDHTSTLATIEAKWNLPALTMRDANAATMMDFLDPTKPALLHPPALTPPNSLIPGELACLKGQVAPPAVRHDAASAVSPSTKRRRPSGGSSTPPPGSPLAATGLDAGVATAAAGLLTAGAVLARRTQKSSDD